MCACWACVPSRPSSPVHHEVLRSLPALLDLCVDGNPFTAPCNNPHLAASTAAAVAVTAAAVGGSSGPGRRQQPQSCWCREAVLVAVCAPSLLMLDGRNVSCVGAY